MARRSTLAALPRYSSTVGLWREETRTRCASSSTSNWPLLRSNGHFTQAQESLSDETPTPRFPDFPRPARRKHPSQYREIPFSLREPAVGRARKKFLQAGFSEAHRKSPGDPPPAIDKKLTPGGYVHAGLAWSTAGKAPVKEHALFHAALRWNCEAFRDCRRKRKRHAREPTAESMADRQSGRYHS